MHLRDEHAPLVIILSFNHKDLSPRCKQTGEPAICRYTYNLELHSPAETDEELRTWRQESWRDAG